MAERRTASAPGAAATPAPVHPAGEGERERHQTARVPSSSGAQLPNWFWGALGCLIVLGVGFTVMLFVVRSSAEPSRPAVVGAPGALPTAAQGKGIQVEQLAPPPAPAPAPVPARKAAPRAIKVARSPAPAGGSTTTSRPATDDDAAVEAAFGITGDKVDRKDEKADDRNADRENAEKDDEPMPSRRKARVQAAPPATEVQGQAQGQAEDKESP
jgi:hypothetical protein